MRHLLWTMLVVLSASTASAQLQIIDPVNGAYVSGEYVVLLTYSGDLKVVKTRLYLDGESIFQADGWKQEITIDFGDSILRHSLMATIELEDGGSLKSNVVATRELVVNYEETTQLILVSAVVKTRSGHPLIDLQRDEFEVFEDGKQLEIHNFYRESIPLDLVVLLDSSSSLKEDITVVKRNATDFINKLEDSDSISLYEFKTEPNKLVGFTNDRKKLARAIEPLISRGETALFDTLHQGINDLAKRKRARRALILFTDGRDSIYLKPQKKADLFRDAVTEAQNGEITIYTIGLGKKINEPMLERLAGETGGEYYYADRIGGLNRIFDEILANLKHQYVLGVKPLAKRSGFHRLDVQVKRRGAGVYARKGYTLN